MYAGSGSNGIIYKSFTYTLDTFPKLKKNSLSTTIASPGINDTDTVIPVTDLSVFYNSDSELISKSIVIGYDNSNETYAEEITITEATGITGPGNLIGATRGVNADGSIGAARAWDSGTNIAVMFSTGIYEQIRANQINIRSNTREILTANRTYYVATTGNDTTGDGSSGNPWATIQHAYDVIVATLDTAGYTVTIQVADGTYTTGIEITKAWMGGGNVHILGNTSTPSNVVISTGGNRPFYAHDTSLPTTLVYKGFQLNTTTNCIYFSAIGSLRIGNIYFNNSGDNTITVGVASQIYTDYESFRVLNSDTLYSFISASNMGMFQGYGMNIDYIGSPTYTTGFINIKSVSSADLRAMTFSGSATCAYYNVSLNGVLYISGATLPGNTAGTTSTGGQVL